MYEKNLAFFDLISQNIKFFNMEVKLSMRKGIIK